MKGVPIEKKGKKFEQIRQKKISKQCKCSSSNQSLEKIQSKTTMRCYPTFTSIAKVKYFQQCDDENVE